MHAGRTQAGDVGRTAVDSQRVLKWNAVDGVKVVNARSVARGVQDPDLKDGAVDSERCVSLRSPHLQVIS